MAVTLRVTLTENSYSVVDNTSNVTARVYADSTNSYNLYSPSGSISFGGNASGTYSFTHTFNTYSTTLLYERTFTVTHNADGSGSVSASANFNTEVSAGVIYADASLTLTKIPRASSPTVTGDLVMGSPITIDTNRQVSSYTHTLRYSFQGHSGTIASNVGASYKWTPATATFAPWITNATSAVCTIYCDTYSGSTLVGTVQVSFNLAVPSSVQPSISTITITDNSGYLSTYGAYVQSRSSVRAAVTASAMYGAYVSRVVVEMDGLSAQGTNTATGSRTFTLTIGAPANTGTRTIRVTAYDSRGRSVSATRTISVAAYSAPAISSSTQVYRYDTTLGVADDESTTVRVHVVGSITNVNNAGKNAATIIIRSKLHSATSWTQNASISNSGSSINVYRDITGFSETSSYDVQVTITDSFGNSAQQTYSIGTASPVIDLRSTGEGIAFFGVSTEDQVKVMKRIYNANNQGFWMANADNSMWYRIIALTSTNRIYIGSTQMYTDENTALDNWVTLHQHENMYLYPQKYLRIWNNALSTSQSILGFNSSDQLEFLWNNNGLNGDVRKTIWSGSAALGSSITCSPIHNKYNFFLFSFSGTNIRLFGVRQNNHGSGSYIWAWAFEQETNQNLFSVRFQCTSTSAMTWQTGNVAVIGSGGGLSVAGSGTFGRLTAVEGII